MTSPDLDLMSGYLAMRIILSSLRQHLNARNQEFYDIPRFGSHERAAIEIKREFPDKDNGIEPIP